MWRHAALGSLAALLMAFAAREARAQDRVPTAPAAGQQASDFLTAQEAASILGTSVEARTVAPLQSWYVETGYSSRPPKDKSVRLSLLFWVAPHPDDLALKKQLYVDYPKAGAVISELPDLADAALWIWVPRAGGTLYAFQGGTTQVEVTLSGLPESVALQRAKALAAKALGGSAGTGYAYPGTPTGDAAQAATEQAASAAEPPMDPATLPEPEVAPLIAPIDSPSAAPISVATLPAALTSVADAAYITQAAFLRELKEVSLTIELEPELTQYISEDEARADTIEALAAYGIEVVETAGARLDVRVLYFHTEIVFAGESHYTHEFLLSLDFVVRAALRRQGVFHVINLPVAGERGWDVVFEASEFNKLVFGDALPTDMKAELPKLLRFVLATIAANEAVDERPWYATNWTDTEKAAANADFVAVMTSPDPADRAGNGLESMPVYQLGESADDESCAAWGEWQDLWVDGFKELGWVNDNSKAECPLMLAHFFTCDYVQAFDVADYYRLMNVMQLKQSNAVFALNGRLVRKPAVLASWFKIDAALDDDLYDALEGISYEVMGAVDKLKEQMK